MFYSSNEPTSDWRHQRSVRRFPEKNSSILSSNINPLKAEQQVPPYYNRSNRDNENCERNIDLLLSASLMNSSNNRVSDSDSNNTFYKGITSSSPPNSPGTDSSFNHLINCMSSQSKSATKVLKSNITKETESISPILSPTPSVASTAQNKETFIKSVLQNGDYLLKYNSWHEFRGADEIKKCSGKVIERNENIWELVAIDYSHFRLLVNIRDVYCKNYPYLEGGSHPPSSNRIASNTRSDSVDSNKSISITEPKERCNNLFESIDTLLPGIDDLIECHAKICDCLLNNHVIRPDRVITEIGRVLHESIPDDFIPKLAELYGCINFTKTYINQKLSIFKKYPVFLSYIHKCERDPRCDKKTLADILLHISIHWSKKVTTINSIIANTINDSHDLNNLIKFKEKVDKIVNEASNVMDNQMNLKMLLSLVENYEINPEIEESELVYSFMTADNAKLIYNGKVQMELKKSSNGKLFTREVHGVALEDCIFFLLVTNEPGKSIPKYQLFKDRESIFPAVLEWGKLYGYFREEDSKNSDAFSFYVIIEKPDPSIKRLFVGTPQDRSYWKKCMMQGFSLWQSETSQIKDADNQLQEEIKKIDKKWTNTQFGIDLIKNLDNSLKVQLEYRTVGFRCILEEELKRLMLGNSLVKRSSSNSVATVTDNDVKKDEMDFGAPACFQTYLPDLSTREGINDWLEMFMEWVNRLKFSLCSSGTNITRSASEIEARKRRSIPTVKKYDTFTSRGSPSYDKQNVDITLDNPPIVKQKKDQRRISVSGFANLFRINNKASKLDDIYKSNDHTSPTDSNVECEMDSMTLSGAEMITEGDYFLSSLSKDAVVAFNEINIAAKNITIELLNLRTQNMALEANIKKLQEENQAYREFQRKYKKSALDAQAGLSTGNNTHHKNEAVNNSLGLIGLHTTGSTDVISDGLDNIYENPPGFAPPNQQMVECRRQIENLRQKYEQFAKEKKLWEKEYEVQRRKIENDKENIFQKSRELEKEKENLMEREKKHKDSCLSLQHKIDMYEKHGIKLEEELQPLSESSTPHNFKESGQQSGPVIPPIAYTEATLYNSDKSGHKNTDQNIPDQLKGSLINQTSTYNQYSFQNNFGHKQFERHSLSTNNSDHVLESRSSTPGNYSSKPRMTPSLERKDIYSNSNFTLDDKEERDYLNDFEENNPSSKRPVPGVTHKAFSMSDHNKPLAKSTHIGHTTSDISDNKTQSLGIPLDLAAKSKIKKEKTKWLKLL